MAPVVTAVISDLHLGSRTGRDLLARAEIRESLLAELTSVDHLILLGDTIELRDGPPENALAAATPFFEALGEAMAGRRVTVLAGNHDYQLASRWLARRDAAQPLGLEQLSSPHSDDPLGRVAGLMAATELTLGYPGVWVRPDVYATHGHYLDCHSPAATFECLACSAVARAKRVRRFREPDDYEAVVRPVYRLIYRIAQARRGQPTARMAKAAVRWTERRLGMRSHDARALPGVEAMAQVVARLRIDAGHVIFGHIHHPGRWEDAGGTALVNAGSWFAEAGHRYGTCVIVREEGAPELKQVIPP
jgi:UDP-2,3-diacylglucosamine pyrophosphatase LpxH